MVASINFKPMIASNIPKLSKGIKIGGGVIGAVGIIGLAAYYVLKDAGWDHLDKDDNKEETPVEEPEEKEENKGEEIKDDREESGIES